MVQIFKNGGSELLYSFVSYVICSHSAYTYDCRVDLRFDFQFYPHFGCQRPRLSVSHCIQLVSNILIRFLHFILKPCVRKSPMGYSNAFALCGSNRTIQITDYFVRRRIETLSCIIIKRTLFFDTFM